MIWNQLHKQTNEIYITPQPRENDRHTLRQGMIPEIMKNEGIVAKIYKFPKKKSV